MRHTGIYNGCQTFRPYGSYRIIKVGKKCFTVAFDILQKEIKYIDEGEEVTLYYLNPEKFMIKKY